MIPPVRRQRARRFQAGKYGGNGAQKLHLRQGLTTGHIVGARGSFKTRPAGARRLPHMMALAVWPGFVQPG